MSFCRDTGGSSSGAVRFLSSRSSDRRILEGQPGVSLEEALSLEEPVKQKQISTFSQQSPGTFRVSPPPHFPRQKNKKKIPRLAGCVGIRPAGSCGAFFLGERGAGPFTRSFFLGITSRPALAPLNLPLLTFAFAVKRKSFRPILGMRIKHLQTEKVAFDAGPP